MVEIGRTLVWLVGIGKSEIQYIDVPVRCGTTGFPSPAEDYTQKKLSLDELLNLKENTTFYFRAEGNSMCEIGIGDGDILIVDTTKEPLPDKICLCRLDGELVCKLVEKRQDGLYLVSANKNIRPILIPEESELLIFGVITHTLKKV